MQTPIIVRVFLASSEELKQDREAVTELIQKLNDVYDGKIIFKLEIWEHFDNGYNGIPSQYRYDQKVKTSQLFIALFHRKAGRYTIEELYEARKNQQKQGFPNIYVFQKKLNEGEEEERRLQKLKAIIGQRYNFFIPPAYNHSSELCLDVNMSAQRLLKALQNKEGNRLLPYLDGISNMEIRDSNIMLGNTCIGNIEHLSFSANNSEVIRLKKVLEEYRESLSEINREITELQNKIEEKNTRLSRYEDLEHPGVPKDDYREAWEDAKDYVEMLTQTLTEKQYKQKHILNCINQSQEDLEQQNKLLLNIVYQLNKLAAESTSQRLQKVAFLLEQGNDKEVTRLLNVDDINKEGDHNIDKYKQAKLVMEDAQKLIRNNVEELLLCAKSRLIDLSNPNRFREACNIRERAIQVAEECLPEDECAYITYKYARFLDKNNRFKKSLDFYKRAIERYLSLPENKYLNSFHLEYINLLFPSQNLSLIARSFNLVGNLHNRLGQYQEAEASYQKALLLYTVLSNHYPDNDYDHYIFLVKSNLSVLHYQNGKKEEGEKLNQEIRDQYEDLCEDKRKKYKADIAMAWMNLGCFYKNDTRKHRRARVFIYYALRVYRELEKLNPGKYAPSIAKCLYNLGDLCAENGWTDSEALLLESLEIRKKLADQKPESYLPELAGTYLSLGKLYWYQAEKIAERLNTCSQGAKESATPDMQKYNERISTAINMYEHTLKNYIDMETEILRDSDKKYTSYTAQIAYIYFYLGKLYTDIGQSQKACGNYNQSLKIFNELSSQNSAYKHMIEIVKCNLGLVVEHGVF
ncbi:Tetratricopeptide repeat-containing protein [Bacteroides faecichinchillae]|uniref:Tetratricopeptide repeat-containing protein n=1 Tax=Bacteroides faecichinchillae TaxID=871325 RepID=A0A1M5FX41_9BACE|nr:tetratricopeptide repeat protein [Bacteroides faecichinchillae]THG56805.1 tetratricopeptide repeat protein [Bacteroides faecichinchillae]SHF96130.1 Tetratricopeptide repeat-containing protein [Bacteroides faecichinchillae]